jgi:hypothetical protein
MLVCRWQSAGDVLRPRRSIGAFFIWFPVTEIVLFIVVVPNQVRVVWDSFWVDYLSCLS